MLLLFCAGCVATGKQPVRADQGVFHLTDELLADGKVIALDGEWEFYWDRLLTPADFSQDGAQPEMTGFFKLPASWRRYKVDGKSLGSTGKATYRLRLLTTRASGRLTLRLFDIHEAYRLWVNGKLVSQRGVPGDSAEAEKPARGLQLAEIPFEGRPLELVLQVSNYHFRLGGITEPVLAALPGPLEASQTRTWASSFFFIGCILVMGVYHLVLYLWRKRDRAPLFFGLYCFLVVGYSATSNTSGWVASLLFPSWDPGAMEIFSLTCFVCWASLIYRFLKTVFPDEFHTLPMYFLDGRIVVFFVLLLFAPGLPLYWFIALCLVQTFVYAGYYLHRVSLCVRRGRTGAGILLSGLCVQFLAGINDPLVHMGLIKSVYMLEPAVFLFIMSQALVMSKRFSRAFDSVERLSVELEQKNESLQAEIEERNKLEKKVVSTSEEERRHLSYELHDSLCQQLTGARLRSSALAHEHADNKDGQELAELSDILKNATTEAYKIARGLYPVEHGDAGPSLKNLARSIAKATGINVDFTWDCQCDQCTNENIIPLYRIAQEALSNAAKHAKAENIQVKLSCCGNGSIMLTVTDDGVGCGQSKTEDGGLGMGIMHHRAKIIGAQLQIDRGPKGGTRVLCVAPCNASTHKMADKTDE